MLPARSSPSAPRRSSVSSSSSSPAPFVATERLRIQLVNRSQIQGPLHAILFLRCFGRLDVGSADRRGTCSTFFAIWVTVMGFTYRVLDRGHKSGSGNTTARRGL